MKNPNETTTHTPGPWDMVVEDFRVLVVAVECGRDLVADCGHKVAGRNQANARLIAAAPDLLALADMVEAVNVEERRDAGEMFNALSELQDAARAAIAKARGES